MVPDGISHSLALKKILLKLGSNFSSPSLIFSNSLAPGIEYIVIFPSDDAVMPTLGLSDMGRRFIAGFSGAWRRFTALLRILLPLFSLGFFLFFFILHLH